VATVVVATAVSDEAFQRPFISVRADLSFELANSYNGEPTSIFSRQLRQVSKRTARSTQRPVKVRVCNVLHPEIQQLQETTVVRHHAGSMTCGFHDMRHTASPTIPTWRNSSQASSSLFGISCPGYQVSVVSISIGMRYNAPTRPGWVSQHTSNCHGGVLTVCRRGYS